MGDTTVDFDVFASEPDTIHGKTPVEDEDATYAILEEMDEEAYRIINDMESAEEIFDFINAPIQGDFGEISRVEATPAISAEDDGIDTSETPMYLTLPPEHDDEETEPTHEERKSHQKQDSMARKRPMKVLTTFEETTSRSSTPSGGHATVYSRDTMRNMFKIRGRSSTPLQSPTPMHPRLEIRPMPGQQETLHTHLASPAPMTLRYNEPFFEDANFNLDVDEHGNPFPGPNVNEMQSLHGKSPMGAATAQMPTGHSMHGGRPVSFSPMHGGTPVSFSPMHGGTPVSFSPMPETSAQGSRGPSVQRGGNSARSSREPSAPRPRGRSRNRQELTPVLESPTEEDKEARNKLKEQFNSRLQRRIVQNSYSNMAQNYQPPLFISFNPFSVHPVCMHGQKYSCT